MYGELPLCNHLDVKLNSHFFILHPAEFPKY